MGSWKILEKNKLNTEKILKYDTLRKMYKLWHKIDGF